MKVLICIKGGVGIFLFNDLALFVFFFHFFFHRSSPVAAPKTLVVMLLAVSVLSICP